MSGLLLKTNIRMRLDGFPVDVINYIKAHIFAAIGDPTPMIRNTVGTVIDTLIVELGPANWPEALSTLMELVDSPDRFVQEVSITQKDGNSKANGRISTGSFQLLGQTLSRHSEKVRTYGSGWDKTARLYDS